MEIEELSKSQIVLLTLLVSFITSIATGIVTVSLMDQAPPAIAQTVNRVIERTVETVAPTTKGQTASTVVTQEKTVVIKESELISQAVNKATPSIVRLYRSDPESTAFFGLGIVVDKNGTIAADSAMLGDAADAMVVLSTGARVRAFVRGRDEGSGLAFLEASSTSEVAPDWKPATIATGQAVLGQSVVALSGKSVARIAQGLVTAIPESALIDTDIDGAILFGGAPLINTEGNFIGISTGVSRASGVGTFVSTVVLLPPPKQQ